MAESERTEPQVPCPYESGDTVGLSYYLAHQADFCLHRGEHEEAKLFHAAANWVRGKSND